jgi:hypothetical protein
MFPQLKMKMNGRHVDTTEEIGAESQAVLNTLKEHDFQDGFKIWQKQKGTTSRVMVGWWPVCQKLVSDQAAAQVREIMDVSL